VFVAAAVALLTSVVAACGGSSSSTSGERGVPIQTTVPAPTTQARSPLVAGPIAAWGGAPVKVACLAYSQETPQVSGYTYPVGDWVNQLLAPVGVTTVAPGQPCDATLDVSLYLEGRPGQYDDGNGEAVTLYSGMLRHFDLTLTAPGQPAVTGFTDDTDQQPGELATSSSPRTPQEFLDKWGSVFRKFTINGLVQVWGAPVGIEALNNPDRAFDADQALRDLSGLGRPGTPPAPSGYDGWRQWYESTT
jgi:hypothetical protein